MAARTAATTTTTTTNHPIARMGRGNHEPESRRRNPGALVAAGARRAGRRLFLAHGAERADRDQTDPHHDGHQPAHAEGARRVLRLRGAHRDPEHRGNRNQRQGVTAMTASRIGVAALLAAFCLVPVIAQEPPAKQDPEAALKETMKARYSLLESLR